MKYIRIGNDINVVWSILTAEGAPYNLGNVTLKMSCAGVVVPIENYSVVGNKVLFTFYGKDQKNIGVYTLTLIENAGEVNMHTVDACKVFKLVSTSCETANSHTINPEVESLALVTQVEFVKGESGGGGTTIVIDNALSTTSANPVENRVITNAINKVADDIEAEEQRAIARENEVLAEAKDYADTEIGKINIPSIEGLATEQQLSDGVQAAKDYTDEQIGNIDVPEVDLSEYASKEFVNNRVDELNQGIAESKQDKLISGTNIKTINGQPVLGSGNIEISGGGGMDNPLRALYIAAGAEYNDTDNHIVKDTPWKDYVDSVEYKAQWDLDVVTGSVQTLAYSGKSYEYVDDNGTWKIITRVGDKLVWDDTKVIHRKGYYYLNGLGDITENELAIIYRNTYNGIHSFAYYRNTARIINISGTPSFVASGLSHNGLFANCSNSEIIYSPNFYVGGESSHSMFIACTKLRYIYIPSFSITTADLTNAFVSCGRLSLILIKGLKTNISFVYSPNISRKSIMYIVTNAAPTTAITITLHPDAYARLENDSDIVEALGKQPLVTLGSA